jgi:hypothetical protein
MRKLLVSIATAVILINIAGATQIATLLGETSIVAPVAGDHNLLGIPEREHSLHQAHMPPFTS